MRLIRALAFLHLVARSRLADERSRRLRAAADREAAQRDRLASLAFAVLGG